MKPYDIEVLVSPLVTVNKKRTKKNNKRKTPYHFEMDYAIMKNNIIER